MIPAGKLPPNPSELLSSERMSEILRTVGEQADIIIIDTPPIHRPPLPPAPGQTLARHLALPPGA